MAKEKNEEFEKATERVMKVLEPFSKEDQRKIGYRINFKVKKLFDSNEPKKEKPNKKKRSK